MEKKKPIAPILHKMKVGEIQSWDIRRYSVIDNAIHRLVREKYPDRKYPIKANFTTVEVKRIK